MYSFAHNSNRAKKHSTFCSTKVGVFHCTLLKLKQSVLNKQGGEANSLRIIERDRIKKSVNNTRPDKAYDGTKCECLERGGGERRTLTKSGSAKRRSFWRNSVRLKSDGWCQCVVLFLFCFLLLLLCLTCVCLALLPFFL